MAAPQPSKDDFRAALVYERSITREIRVLESKVTSLERQLNSELEKISSCTGLLEEIIDKPQGSPCASVRAELDRVRAKRERAYLKFERQQQQQQQQELEILQGSEDDDNKGRHGGAPYPPEAAASN